MTRAQSSSRLNNRRKTAMSTSFHRPTLVTAALLGALILAVPSQAQTTQGQTGAQATTTQAAPTKTATKAPKKTAVDTVESRIADLHVKLKITPDQEPKWTEVAQVMRDNAKKMDELFKQRSQNLRTMTAIDDLRSYRDFTDAHSQGLQKLITAFEGLYTAMTPDQKKNADMVFAQSYGPNRGDSRGKVAKGS
jgi:periplasmic protein CpxP/Spy